jgi:hypothetical protein
MFTVVIPVADKARELDRLGDTLESLQAHTEPAMLRVVLIDDSPRPRSLDRYWPGATIVRTELRETGVPDPRSAMTAGTIEGLRQAGGDFALKLDTDALVIAPFADALQSAFAADPSVGLLGAFDLAPDGGLRDWSIWRRPIWFSRSPIRATRRAGRRLPDVDLLSRAEWAKARGVVRAAKANPSYSLGAHCLGGAYAVSSRLFARHDLLDWRPWVLSRLPEDVVMGLLCAAAGMRMLGMTGTNEPFGLSWRGLPADPEQLAERGYSIVHSVQDSDDQAEWDLRAWFRSHTR